MRTALLCITALVVTACGSTHAPDAVGEPTGDAVEALSDGGASCTSVSLSASLPSPQAAGASIAFTADAKCGKAAAEYEFHLRPSGGIFAVVQGFSAAATWTWATTSVIPAAYDVEVTVHAKGGKGTQAKDTIGYTIAESCNSEPTLRPQPGGTLYCDGSGAADGGVLDCETGQQCCLGGEVGGTFDPQECVKWGRACKNGGAADAGTGNFPAIPIACQQVADCAANGDTTAKSCCLQGATAPADPPGCDYLKSTLGTAIVCEKSATCAAGEVQVCQQQADCPAGTTCTAGRWKIYEIGFCVLSQ